MAAASPDYGDRRGLNGRTSADRGRLLIDEHAHGSPESICHGGSLLPSPRPDHRRAVDNRPRQLWIAATWPLNTFLSALWSCGQDNMRQRGHVHMWAAGSS
jgi:hypothetical protein